MHSARRSLIALGLSTLLLVGGCNGDSNASDEPTKTFTPTVSSSPSEPASTYTPPEPAKPPKGGWPEDKPANEISAEEVARIWVQSYSEALNDGDVSRLRRLATPACSNCETFIGSIEDLDAAGGSLKFKGTPYRSGDLTFVDKDSAPLIKLQMVVSSASGRRVSEPGDEATPFAAEKNEWFFDLIPVRGRWRIKRMGFVE